VTQGQAEAILVAAALALASCAGVQRQPAPQPVPGTAPVAALTPTSGAPAAAEVNRKLLGQLTPAEESGDLPLGAGDLVEVSVFDVQELSSLKLRIPNSGNITLPLIGTLPAAGASAVELQDAIRGRLQEKYMHDPQVTLFVHEHKSQRISVVGAVRTGGVFTLTSRLRLADALAMAGGLGDDAGSTVYVIRRAPAETVAGPTPATDGATKNGATEQVMTTIDLQSLVAGRQELNLPLQAGDVIEVPRAGSFYVGGEVNRPGSFLLKSRTTLDQAPVVAGGVKEHADWDDVRVYRTRGDGTREVLTFSLNEFEKGEPAPEIQANDVVIVGKSGLKAFLYAVRDIFKFGVGASASVPLFP
jgi:polysaccharide export outer membrane protein